MDKLKEKFKAKADALSADIKDIVKNNGDLKLGEITVAQVYQGMRGMVGMVTETSRLDPEEGIRFRGYTIPELRKQLPKAPGGTEPLPEGIFYLMLVGELPTQEDVTFITTEWTKRNNVPKHVFDVIEKLPPDTHPMTQFVIGVMAMQTESVFAKAYAKGINKKEYWDYVYEDSMNLIARLPRIAAYIYRRKYKGGVHIEPDHKLDWAANFAHMLGFEAFDMKRLMRLYLTIHVDHEGGNVSAHTTHLVGSALADPYLSFAAGMNGLAGPLHGLANQEVLSWIMELKETLGGGLPTKEQIAEYIKKTLTEGKVVPGYGHAVLRKTDPRFTAQQDFYKTYIKHDDICEIVQMIYEVAPPILEGTGKIKNPWPNVDAHSGALLVHYGMHEYDFYTVLFGVSRALGVLASLIWDRATGSPIERPGSLTTDNIKAKIKAAQEAAKKGINTNSSLKPVSLFRNRFFFDLNTAMEKKKIGLTLSGGGARGYGHLGVIKALEERGIKPDIISGTSAGAMVAAFYAAGYNTDAIINISKKTGFFGFKHIQIGKAGIFNMKALEELITEHIPGNDFASLKIPIYVCASDVVNTKSVYFSSGILSSAIMASSCIPMIYEPVKFNDTYFLDGGLLDNFPVNIIRDKCDFLIGSYMNQLSKKIEHFHMKDLVDRSFHMALGVANEQKSKECDLYIAPIDMSRFGMFDVSQINDIVDFCYEYTCGYLAKIKFDKDTIK